MLSIVMNVDEAALRSLAESLQSMDEGYPGREPVDGCKLTQVYFTSAQKLFGRSLIYDGTTK